MCESAPPVTIRPSLRYATALTAPSWNRRTCSATLRVSDQRIAEVSKLPEIACDPSGETARARTGPPWPRNWANAALNASGTNSRPMLKLLIACSIVVSDTTAARRNLAGGFHSEFAYTSADGLFAQRGEKRLQGRPLAPALHDQEIIMFGRNRQKPESVKSRDRFDGKAPVRSSLRDRSGNRIV